MANLTTEYLEKALDKALNKQSREFDKKLDTKLAAQSKEFDKKLERRLQETTTSITSELKAFIKDENEALARMVAQGFEDLEKRLDVKERMDKLEKEFAQLKQALRM